MGNDIDFVVPSEYNDIGIVADGCPLLEDPNPMIFAETTIDVSLEEIERSGNVFFEYKNKKCKLVVSPKETKIISDAPSLKSYIFFSHYKLAIESEDDAEVECICLWAMSQRDGELFSEFPISKKDYRFQTFFGLLPTQREYIRKRSRLPKQNNEGYKVPISDESGLKLLFELCGQTYSPEIQVQAELLLNEIRQGSFLDKGDLIKRLSFMLNVGAEKYEAPNLSYDQIIDILSEYVYGMHAIKRVIAERIMYLVRSGKMLSGILIEGNPGVGKTSIGMGIAKSYNLPFHKINCDGIDPLALKGLVSSYRGAKPGIPAKLFYQIGKHFVMFFDEIDKMAKSNECDPFSVIATMLGPEKVLHDEFVDVDMDTSECVVIATCNDLSKIPGYIKDRFSLIIKANDLSLDEKVIVARNYIIPQIFKESKISENELVIDDSILEFIVKRYCDDHGARKMRSCLESIVCAVVSDWSKGAISESFRVTKEFVMERLDDIMEKRASMGFAG